MVFRSLLIVLNTVISTLLFIYTDFIITSVLSLFFIAIQIYLLFQKDRKTRDSLITFLESSIDEDRYNLSLVNKSDFSKKINNTLKRLKMITHEKEIEFESKLNLLSAIIQQIKTGVILFDESGKIVEINRAARILLGCGYIDNINTVQLLGKDVITDFSRDLVNYLLDIDGENLLLDSSTLEFNSEKVRIISIQNIKPLLNEQEMNSWNRLIRSLNHELMNSITPISSLASTAVKLLDKESNPDLAQAIRVIESRSSNLLRFIDSYKSYSQLPEPKKELIKLKDFLENIRILISKSYTRVKVFIVCDETYYLFADPSQMEQVALNLIKNSIEADSTEIQIKVEESDRTTIKFIDNGRGFSEETKEKAFIPFYSTKNIGSGLGLAIVKQIVILNEGTVELLPSQQGAELKITF